MLATAMILSLLLSLPPLSWPIAMVVFAIFCPLWVTGNPELQRAAMLGVTLALAYAITEVAFPNHPVVWTLGALSELGNSFLRAFFSAIHLPIFFLAATWIHHRFHIRRRQPLFIEVWFALGIPSLFVVCESLVPRPLAWKLGHSLFRYSWILQGSEFVGVQYLSFALIGMGSLLCLLMMPSRLRFPDPHPILSIASILYWLVPIWGMRNVEADLAEFRSYAKTASPRFLQLGIVSLDKAQPKEETKLAAEITPECIACIPDIPKLVQWSESLTQDSIHRDIILWPFLRGTTRDQFQTCEASLKAISQKLNSLLLISRSDGKGLEQVHVVEASNVAIVRRNLQKLAPESLIKLADVTNGPDSLLESSASIVGTPGSRTVLLKTGERLGVTFANELEVNSSAQYAIDDGIYALFAFGGRDRLGLRASTWEKAFDTLRTVEYRIPIIRVSEKGNLFMVDSVGSIIADDEGGEEPHTIKRSITLPMVPPRTLYASSNDWFSMLCLTILGGFFLIIFRRKTQPIPMYLREAQRHQQATQALRQTARSQEDSLK